MWIKNNNELYHYGVKGMKWGVRKSDKYKAKARLARESADEWDEMAGYAEAKGKIKRATKFRSYAEQDRRNADSYDKRALGEIQKVANTKAAVRSYQKHYDQAILRSDKADEKVREAKSAYKALGKTRLSRIINAARNKTPEAKVYHKLMDEAIRESDLADEKWSSVNQEYKNTGRTYVSRILNNARYG